jgi:hypothetical protein
MAEREIVRRNGCPIAFKTPSIQYVETGDKKNPQLYTPNKKKCRRKLKHKCEHKHHHKHHHHHHHEHEHEVIPVTPIIPPPPAPPAPPSPQAEEILQSAANFRVLAGSTITNSGPTIISGDLGLSPGTAVTGFPPGTVVGTQHITDATAAQAQLDLTAGYNTVAGTPTTVDLTGQDLGGMTLAAGVYNYDTSAQLTGHLIFDGGGDPTTIWMFKIGSTLTTANASSVTFINGGLADNVFWQVGSSATIGGLTAFAGNILALASISFNTAATISGRALARTGAVTLLSNSVGP